MIIREQTFIEYKKCLIDKNVVIFGASDFLLGMIDNYPELDLKKKCKYIIDSNEKKWNTTFSISQRFVDVFPFEHIYEEDVDKTILLIASSVYSYDMYEQISNDEKLKELIVFILPLMIGNNIDDTFRKSMVISEKKIPRVIHCFWFSGEELSDLAQKCMDSWKKACPEYEIKLWTADNYDCMKNDFMKEAFFQKKWAFVADYARVDVLNREGGFYFDLDVELVKNIDDLRGYDFVIGYGPYRDIEAAAFGSIAGHWLLKRILNYYDTLRFDSRNISFKDLQPSHLGRILKEEGFLLDGKYVNKSDIVILPRDVFSARNPFSMRVELTEGSYGVHYCAGGWLSDEKKRLQEKKKNGYISLERIFNSLP